MTKSAVFGYLFSFIETQQRMREGEFRQSLSVGKRNTEDNESD